MARAKRIKGLEILGSFVTVEYNFGQLLVALLVGSHSGLAISNSQGFGFWINLNHSAEAPETVKHDFNQSLLRMDSSVDFD